VVAGIFKKKLFSGSWRIHRFPFLAPILMTEKPRIILTIAGFDPSSGAGVTADIKTIAAHGCYGVACITALTVQSTAGVRRVEAVEAAVIRQMLEELAADVAISGVHIGMLGTAAVVQVVAEFLERGGGSAEGRVRNVVLDPVLRSSSGAELLDSDGVGMLIERLIPLAAVITPNVDEAAALTGSKVANVEEMGAAARRLHEMGAAAVVVTGGHLEKAIDLLSFTSTRGIQQELFKTDKLKSSNTHGTGCAFSTSIACHLAADRGLAEAVLLAKTYVTAAIAAGHPLGRGTGPVNHLYRMNQGRRIAGGDS
jgi:hydroxymethylpyrimidine/phosphomethylpyrimidine kinase